MCFMNLLTKYPVTNRTKTRSRTHTEEYYVYYTVSPYFITQHYTKVSALVKPSQYKCYCVTQFRKRVNQQFSRGTLEAPRYRTKPTLVSASSCFISVSLLGLRSYFVSSSRSEVAEEQKKTLATVGTRRTP